MRISMICLTCFSLSVLLFFGTATAFGENSPSQAKGNYVTWPWQVAVNQSSTPEIQAAASRLSKSLKSKWGSIYKANKNPGCCLWIEVGTWTPNPGEPGYLIVIQPGGALLMSTNTKQLNLAIDRLTKIKRIQGENTMLPVGVITSYPVISEK
ncbi:hypothetical protein [Gimesia aquarii]|uniref:Uncharacterized protein n=1 Tax=Gimesia aquarii TaxID=2527964 RepID=A0A517VX35_9PLAN|nr:hypothetical protein [Gimesia aquarii]QDT97559.1 hypothetical protein V144x_30380 [Gimesia aquarii]